MLPACQPGPATVTFPGSQHPPTEGPHPGFFPLEPPTFPRGPGDEVGAGHGRWGVCVAAEGTRVVGVGTLTIPTAGGEARKGIYTLTACITACHNHHPKGCQDFGGESGWRDSWAGPGTPQAVDKVPTWQGSLPKEVSVQSYSLHPDASRSARAGGSGRQRMDTISPPRPGGLPLPAQPQRHPRKPLPRAPLYHLGKHTLGKAVPPHTHPPCSMPSG